MKLPRADGKKTAGQDITAPVQEIFQHINPCKTTMCHLHTSVFLPIKQTTCDMLFLIVFPSDRSRLAVSSLHAKLSRAKWLLTIASYLPYRHESAVNLLM